MIQLADNLDPTPEPFLSPSEVARSRGLKAPQTVVRWIRKGVTIRRAGRSVIVKLRATRCGGRWRITPTALEEFEQRTTDQAAGEPIEATKRQTSLRLIDPDVQRRHDGAMDRLRARGLVG